MRNSRCVRRAKTSSTRRRALVVDLVMLAAVGLLVGSVARAQDAAEVDSEHYKVELENDRVRVLRINYGPHEKSVMHSHPEGVVVFLNDMHGRFVMPGGETVEHAVQAGTVQWAEAEAHQPQNLSEEPLEVIQIELKSAGAADVAAAEEMIRASAPAWAAAYNAGDAEGLAAMYCHHRAPRPPRAAKRFSSSSRATSLRPRPRV